MCVVHVKVFAPDWTKLAGYLNHAHTPQVAHITSIQLYVYIRPVAGGVVPVWILTRTMAGVPYRDCALRINKLDSCAFCLTSEWAI